MTETPAFRYHMMPLDLVHRRWHIQIRRRHPQLTDWIYHLTRLAQDARQRGHIYIGGVPAGAEDIALAWDHRASDEDIAEWQQVLEALTKAGVLTAQESGWSLTRPADWYRPPSSEPEASAERQRRSRAARSQAVTSRHESSQLSRPNQNQNQNQNRTPTPTPSRNGSGVGSGVGLVVEVLDRHWPGGSSTTKSADIAAYLRRPGTLEQKLEAIRQVAEEVAAEIEGGSDIRLPRSVVLHRAPARLAHLRNAPPDPWANPPELPEYAR